MVIWIATKIKSLVPFTTLDPSIKFQSNPFITLWVMLLTDRQTNAIKNITSLANEVINPAETSDYMSSADDRGPEKDRFQFAHTNTHTGTWNTNSQWRSRVTFFVKVFRVRTSTAFFITVYTIFPWIVPKSINNFKRGIYLGVKAGNNLGPRN